MEGSIFFCAITVLLISIVNLLVVLICVKRFVSIFKSLDALLSGLVGELDE